jgi:phospholipid transport system substrate-binding protein
MLRFFSSKILFVFFLAQNLFCDKIPDLHEYIDSNAQYFLTVIKEEGSNYDENPEAFKERLKSIWEPMVVVKVVSRLILSSKIYTSATESQKKLFEERTKKLLLDTYVSTLLEFDNYQILTDEDIKVNKKTFEVSINFFSDSNSFVTKLTVYKNSLGQYRIVNIIVDGINLGLIFRNQFQDAYLENNSNLDIAIESWKPTTL